MAAHGRAATDAQWPQLVQCVRENGVFCVVEDGGQRSTVSSDGVTWTTYSGALPSNNNHGMATDGRVYLIGTGNGYAISNDGATWTYTAVTPVGSLPRYVFNGAKFALIVPASANGIVVTPTWIGAIQPSLAQVVSAECLNSGLLRAGDIDVTALSQSVRGYRIGTVGAIRSALEPLQAAGRSTFASTDTRSSLSRGAAHPSSPSRRPTSMRAMRARIPACRSRPRAKWTASCLAG